jgi:hypothetical protein
LVLIDAVSDRLPWEPIDRGYRRYAEGDVPAAVTAFERASRAVPDSPGLNHNLAVLYFQIGDIPRAVLAAREAVRFAPLSQISRDLLTTIEGYAGIERTITPPHVVHPDHFFMLAAVLANLLFLVMAFASGRSARVVIAGTLLVLLIAGSATGLAVTAVRHGRQLAVVRDEVTLRRIPGEDAAGWLPVQRGASVRVLSRTGNSLLVQTSLGLEGWVELDDVFWHAVPAFSIARYRGFVL